MQSVLFLCPSSDFNEVDYNMNNNRRIGLGERKCDIKCCLSSLQPKIPLSWEWSHVGLSKSIVELFHGDDSVSISIESFHQGVLLVVCHKYIHTINLREINKSRKSYDLSPSVNSLKEITPLLSLSRREIKAITYSCKVLYCFQPLFILDKTWSIEAWGKMSGLSCMYFSV